jgi:hypothetical protein
VKIFGEEAASSRIFSNMNRVNLNLDLAGSSWHSIASIGWEGSLRVEQKKVESECFFTFIIWYFSSTVNDLEKWGEKSREKPHQSKSA